MSLWTKECHSAWVKDMYGEQNYWRESQRPTRFLCFDSRIVGFIALALLHFRLWTLILLAVAACAFVWMDWKGINPAKLFTHIRTFLAGPIVPARRAHELRKPVDFGFECTEFANQTHGRWKERA